MQSGVNLSSDEGESLTVLKWIYPLLLRGSFLLAGSATLFASLWMIESFTLYTFDRDADRFYIDQRYVLHSTKIQYSLKRIQSVAVD